MEIYREKQNNWDKYLSIFLKFCWIFYGLIFKKKKKNPKTISMSLWAISKIYFAIIIWRIHNDATFNNQTHTISSKSLNKKKDTITYFPSLVNLILEIIS